MHTNGIIKLIREKIKLIIVVALMGILTTATIKVKQKLYFIWHVDHYYEMIFEIFRGSCINHDGDKLYVIMENEHSGNALYTVDILTDNSGYKWAFIFELYIYYPLHEDKHGQKYVVMEHEGNKFLYPK